MCRFEGWRGGSALRGFGNVWALWGGVSLGYDGYRMKWERDVLGAVSRPRTVRKPLKAMSSGSGLVSCIRMPTSVVVI